MADGLVELVVDGGVAGAARQAPHWRRAATGTAGLVIGAVAGTGGWLVSAPGTPCAPGIAALKVSAVCWLRMAWSGAGWACRSRRSVRSG